LNTKDDKVDDIKKVYQYVDDFRTEFNQKKYFDSITVKLVNDSIPYKPGIE
jgi:cytochrome c peroxidase